MSNVVDFDGITTHSIDPDKVLKSAVGEVAIALFGGLFNIYNPAFSLHNQFYM